MKIFVTKNLFSISLSRTNKLLAILFAIFWISVVGCTGGKMPPSPDDTNQNVGGTTNQGYVEPMYPLIDAGIFTNDESTKSTNSTNSPDSTTKSSDSTSATNSIDSTNNSTVDPTTTTPPIKTPAEKPTNIIDNKNKKTDNSADLINSTGNAESFLKTTMKIENETEAVILSPLKKNGSNVNANSIANPPTIPIDDLIDQIDEYIIRIGENLEDLKTSENYAIDGDSVYRDASGLALVALAVGLSNNDSKYRKASPELIAATKRLLAANNYNSARNEFESVKNSLKSNGEPSKLKLEKIVKLKPVMKAMPNLNSNVRRLTNTESKLKKQLDKKPKQIFSQLAALAAISECSIPNGDETNKPNDLEKWKKECEQFRDVAIKANNAAHDFANGKIKYDVYWSAFTNLSRSCDSCHNTFYPNAVGQGN